MTEEVTLGLKQAIASDVFTFHVLRRCSEAPDRPRRSRDR